MAAGNHKKGVSQPSPTRTITLSSDDEDTAVTSLDSNAGPVYDIFLRSPMVTTLKGLEGLRGIVSCRFLFFYL
jgi:hypothetical protein